MRILSYLALALAIPIAGCIGSADEPFSLDDGVLVPIAQDGYDCPVMDKEGKATGKFSTLLLFDIRRNNKNQYVVFGMQGAGNNVPPPFTFHHIGGTKYLISMAEGESAGESFFLADFKDGAKSLNILADAGEKRAVIERARALARKHNITIAADKFIGSIGGRVENQRAFMKEFASDPANWEPFLTCKGKQSQ